MSGSGDTSNNVNCMTARQCMKGFQDIEYGILLLCLVEDMVKYIIKISLLLLFSQDV